MEEEFEDGPSGGVIAAVAVSGIVAGGVFSSLIYFIIKGDLLNHLFGNPAPTTTATTNPPLPPTQGGKRRTRRSRPHRGTRRV